MRYFLIAILCLSLTDCSTIAKGTTQAVSIQTPGAEGASCELRSPAIGSQSIVTPASVVLEKSQHSVQVACRKECFSDGAGVIPTEVEAMTAGNILVGGVVGLAVDASTGAMNKYHPEVRIAMAPLPGCRARRG